MNTYLIVSILCTPLTYYLTKRIENKRTRSALGYIRMMSVISALTFLYLLLEGE